MTDKPFLRSQKSGLCDWLTYGWGVLFLLVLVSCAVPLGRSVSHTGVVQVMAGERHTCALTTAGGVKCWGLNHEGQLGDGTKSDRNAPVDVVGLTGVTAISAGWRHTCALTTVGGVRCWGNNHEGEVGDGTAVDRVTPVDVAGLIDGVTAVAVGGAHTCAVTSAGAAKCWGLNHDGQLGDGTKEDRRSPVEVGGLSSGVAGISAGWRHTCALTAGGGVKCWGLNREGQLGDGTNQDRSTPGEVVGLSSGVQAIAARYRHTCALTAAGGVKCWGKNHDGQLGDGTKSDRNIPVEVPELARGVKAIAAGWRHTCALLATGEVRCWGKNHEGQLGDGTGFDRKTPVRAIDFQNDVQAVATGGQHTCALSSTDLRCWGDNEYGQLGDGTSLDTREIAP